MGIGFAGGIWLFVVVVGASFFGVVRTAVRDWFTRPRISKDIDFDESSPNTGS